MNDLRCPEQQRHRPEASNGEQATVLIVDAVCVLSEALANALMREHIALEVRTVADKDGAVSILQSFHPDVVVLNECDLSGCSRNVRGNAHGRIRSAGDCTGGRGIRRRDSRLCRSGSCWLSTPQCNI
jgi:hypothetical protein